MSYFKVRKILADKIDKELRPLSVTQLYEVLSFIEEKKPLTLTEYIKEYFGSNGFGCDDVFKKQDVLIAFEHEVRSICLELGSNFELVEPSSEYIDHFCEMYVEGHELDIWIHENGSVFNPCILAHVIYLLYTGEVVFK